MDHETCICAAALSHAVQDLRGYMVTLQELHHPFGSAELVYLFRPIC